MALFQIFCNHKKPQSRTPPSARHHRRNRALLYEGTPQVVTGGKGGGRSA